MEFISGLVNNYFSLFEDIPKEVYFLSFLPSLMYFIAVPIYARYAVKLEYDPEKKLACDVMVLSTGLAHLFLNYPIYVYLGKDILYFSVWKLFLGMLVMDTFQYWHHYALHNIPGAFKYVHYVHHSMGEPSPYESVLVHPVEALTGPVIMISMFVLAGLSFKVFVIITGLTYVGFVCEHTITTPYKYHYIHHKVNINSNFEAPFFSFWDRLMGTRHPKSDNMPAFYP